jgi:hypothetical protein
MVDYFYITFEAAAPKDEKEKERVLKRLENIAKKYGVRFRRERVKWQYYDIFKREGEKAFAVPWELAYPITKEYVRAAWNYFSKPSNRKFYTPKERKIIIERIARAALKHGIKLRYDPQDPLHRTLPESIRKQMESWVVIDLYRKFMAQLWWS